MKQRLLQIVRQLIRLVPRSKLLHFIAQQYIRKYNNFENNDADTNGEHWWLSRALQSLSQPVIFDVGANVGNWTASALQINPNARIHAFEPVESTYKQLVSRGFENVVCNQSGMGNDQKTMQIFTYPDANSHNSLYPRHDKTYGGVEEIRIDTLDHYCAENNINHIDYLKIDTEGSDFYVLQGAKSLLEAHKIKMLQFEYGNNYIDARIFLKDIFDFIAPLDYSLYRLMPNSLLHLAEYHHSYEVFIYCNYVLLSPEIVASLNL